MPPEYLAVRDTIADDAEVVPVVETVGDYARVEGDRIEGWVEVPDNPRAVEPYVLCKDCGHWEEHPSGDRMVRVDDKRRACNHVENARLLARIHRIQTGHSPSVERRAA